MSQGGGLMRFIFSNLSALLVALCLILGIEFGLFFLGLASPTATIVIGLLLLIGILILNSVFIGCSLFFRRHIVRFLALNNLVGSKCDYICISWSFLIIAFVCGITIGATATTWYNINEEITYVPSDRQNQTFDGSLLRFERDWYIDTALVGQYTCDPTITTTDCTVCTAPLVSEHSFSGNDIVSPIRFWFYCTIRSTQDCNALIQYGTSPCLNQWNRTMQVEGQIQDANQDIKNVKFISRFQSPNHQVFNFEILPLIEGDTRFCAQI
eukprot:TRINITY_DN1525_c0_g1_i2.p1 TRINITY_DN1525_c0_g1~~TRINITY_DN1525_c0_g1_i2.p1  ORF type:complete len:268 (-),score=13.77 TRINITY_DN1525_c0_g1_i2:253-1056(-)